MITDPTAVGFVAATQVDTLFGSVIGAAITPAGNGTAHSWTADATGLFHTATNLQAEWVGLLGRLNAGDKTLTAVQHAEANAEVVFENTNLKNLSAADQARDREDVQREYDAIGAAISKLGITGSFTTQTYLAVETYIQSNTTLQELAIQGHGINNPPLAKYNGYTNDFQNNVDGSTLFIGQGLDSNQNALTDFFDDVIITHLVYPTVTQNGSLEQLNQNAAAEQVLQQAAGAANDTFFLRTFTASEFSATAGHASATPNTAKSVVTGTGGEVTLYGTAIATTYVSNTGLTAAHTWTAEANGLFTTTTDLSAEWLADYTAMQTGHAGTLTAIQRLEGNAEAVFLNTGLNKLSTIEQQTDRQDVQRVFDAIAGGMKALGMDGMTALTQTSYLALEHAIQNNATLHELFLQGYGVNNPISARYNGYINDFSEKDTKTLFVGGGTVLNDGERAVPEFFADNILTLLGFAATPKGGELVQLDQNGQASSTLQAAVQAVDAAMFTDVYGPTNFNIPGSVPVGATSAPAGTVTTLFGFSVPSTVTLNGDTWIADSTGLFNLTDAAGGVSLATAWYNDYQTMLAGNGASLTMFQRWAGNAEAVFENTALHTKNAAILQRDRQDVQREIDAVAGAMAELHISTTTTLTAASYLAIERQMQLDPLLQELGFQGHGLNSPPQAKYNGYTNDFQHNVDGSTNYVGGGLDNGQNALTDFFDDVIITHLVYQTVAQNGQLIQLNQNGDDEQPLAVDVAAANQTMFTRVYVASDFSKNASAVGEVRFISAAAAKLPAPAEPVVGAGQIVTLFGSVISGTIAAGTDGIAHTWVADSTGTFQTSTDLTLEWYQLWQQAQGNGGAGLNAIQRLEVQAETVFLNTGLNRLSEAQQAIDRADAQREFDAIGGALTKMGLGLSTPLTQTTYIKLEATLQADPTLLELAIQGHGLNSPPSVRYRGYTNDFQNNVDNKTLYLGTGLDAGERAIAAFFDDAILSHAPFPTIAINGELVQLNQNGNSEDKLQIVVAASNRTMFGPLLTARDFGVNGQQPSISDVRGVTSITTTDGTVIGGTISTALTPHAWADDGTGLFHTTANLEIEWRTYYQMMLHGQGGQLNDIQRLEGNAEAVFENTSLITQSEANLTRDREDLQREFDAIQAAMKLDGISLSAPLTRVSYLAIERTIDSNATLYELAIQGHGLNSPAETRYRGYTNDFQNNSDNTTLFIGGGLDNNETAVANLLDDAILSHVPFAVVFQNGQLEQLNQNGAAEDQLDTAVIALNDYAYYRTLTAADFSKTASAAHDNYVSKGTAAYDAALAAAVPAGDVKTLYGDVIANTITIDTGLTAKHVWTETAGGDFTTTTDLAAEWQGYYQTMLAGGGASLTAIQRLEANAEAVFESTKIAAIQKANPALVETWREDAQRCFDAMAAAMQIDQKQLGIDPKAQFTTGSLWDLEHTISDTAALQELWLQGAGVAGAGRAYAGAAGDFEVGIDGSTRYVGGGTDNGSNALGTYVPDMILGDLGFGAVWQNGHLVQLGANGTKVSCLGKAESKLNTEAFSTTLTGKSFKS